ncbi:MAG: D-Ala-D-Ala carboxypeptidase family metallohydrolase, partial [Pseudomonadota bacterium]
MNLSPNFTLREFTDSATAVARGWENVPPPEVMPTLRATAAGLEAVRALLSWIVGHDVPVIVTSGYRSPRLNREVGGSATSQHMLGEAVDFRAPQFGTPAQ